MKFYREKALLSDILQIFSRNSKGASRDPRGKIFFFCFTLEGLVRKQECQSVRGFAIIKMGNSEDFN